MCVSDIKKTYIEKKIHRGGKEKKYVLFRSSMIKFLMNTLNIATTDNKVGEKLFVIRCPIFCILLLLVFAVLYLFLF